LYVLSLSKRKKIKVNIPKDALHPEYTQNKEKKDKKEKRKISPQGF
jgi:hypothetical protein